VAGWTRPTILRNRRLVFLFVLIHSRSFL
jgi:hypothetical protein